MEIRDWRLGIRESYSRLVAPSTYPTAGAAQAEDAIREGADPGVPADEAIEQGQVDDPRRSRKRVAATAECLAKGTGSGA